MNENKTFRFDSINTASNLQFVATNMQWTRNFYYKSDDSSDRVYDNKYTMTVNITQNNLQDYGLIKSHTDANGDVIFDDIRVRMIIVLYSDSTTNNPYRYAEAELVKFSRSDYLYTFKFTFETDDLMDLNNRINIKGVYNAKPEELQKLEELENSHGYMNKNTYGKIFILADFGTKPGDKISSTQTVNEDTAEVILYGDDGIGNRTELESIVPVRDDLINQFLNNDLYITRGTEQVNVVTIIKSNESYMNIVKEYNGFERHKHISIVSVLVKIKHLIQCVVCREPCDINEILNPGTITSNRIEFHSAYIRQTSQTYPIFFCWLLQPWILMGDTIYLHAVNFSLYRTMRHIICLKTVIPLHIFAQQLLVKGCVCK